MKEEPLISVIVPNYNHDEFLKKRLESIYNQTYSNFEVILLDDCSSDNSREILEQYRNHSKTIHCFFNTENSGSTFRQWEKGLSYVKGEYIWIAESDDTCEPSFLENLIHPHLHDREIALSYCQSYRMDCNGNIKGTWQNHTEDLFNKKKWESDFIMAGNLFIQHYLIHKNVIPNVSAVLFNRKKIEEIRPLKQSPQMKYYADWYYYIQLLCNSKVAFVSSTLNYFRYHENSVIARAGNDSGWIKIFKMELEGRKQMLYYLKQCCPSNFNDIEEESRMGTLKLHYLTAIGYLSRGSKLRAIQVVLPKPELYKKFLSYWYHNRKKNS